MKPQWSRDITWKGLFDKEGAGVCRGWKQAEETKPNAMCKQCLDPYSNKHFVSHPGYLNTDLPLGDTKGLFTLSEVTLALWLWKPFLRTQICWDKMTWGLGFASKYLSNSKKKEKRKNERSKRGKPLLTTRSGVGSDGGYTESLYHYVQSLPQWLILSTVYAWNFPWLE